MNTTIEKIKPETIAFIEKQAAVFGLSIDDYLQNLLPKTLNEADLKSDVSESEFESDMIEFAADSSDLPEYEGIYSREDIYFDHN